MQAVCLWIAQHFKETVFWVTSNGLKWENKNYKLKRSIALAMPRVSVVDPGKGEKGGGVQGVHPLLKFTYMTRSRFSETFTRVIYMCKSFIKVTPEMFLIIYRPFGLKLKLLPLKDHTEEAIRELKQQRF